jgi:murein DD-endopeptidase MepM/ murein hydrolase activator NlpD
VISPEHRPGVRLAFLGALWGFLAGALVVAFIVWKADPAETWVGASARFIGERQMLADRWDRAPADPAGPTVEPHPDPDSGPRVGTAGSSDGPELPPSISAPPAAELKDRDLVIPVDGVGPDQLVRSFEDARGDSRRHEAIDILAPMGTPVRAVEGGRVARLFNSKAGGITIYQFDPTERYCYYYAHLERYADGLEENDVVARGQIIGYVGVSGNAPRDTPHLHFAVFRLTDEKKWWEGTPLDPFDVLK